LDILLSGSGSNRGRGGNDNAALFLCPEGAKTEATSPGGDQKVKGEI